MATVSNISLIAKGMNNVRAGIERQEVGAAEVAKGLLEVWDTPFRWSYGSGDNEVSGLTTIRDMYHLHLNENTGKEDKQRKSAIYDAVADNFGFDWGDTKEMKSKLKMMFKRAWRIAAAKQIAGVDVRFEQGGRAVSVPLSTVVKLVDDTGAVTERGKDIVDAIKENALDDNKELSDAQALELAHKRRVVCDGKAHKRYGDLPAISALADLLIPAIVAAGGEPAPKPRNSSPKGDKFLDALAYVQKCLDSLVTDEPDIALANEGEKLLREVAEKIAAYFIAK